MNRQRMRVGLALFFLAMVSLIAFQVYTRSEPLHCTTKERRAAEREKDLRRSIAEEVSGSLASSGAPLPKRSRSKPATTQSIPHKQIGVQAVPEIQVELMRRTFLIPGIERGPSFTPYPGAVGILLRRNVGVAQRRALLAGREFSHFHPDGSLHAPLSPARAREAVRAGWAVRHPWADRRAGWEGLVLIYTPQSQSELEVVFELIVDSYNYVTGSSLRAADYRPR